MGVLVRYGISASAPHSFSRGWRTQWASYPENSPKVFNEELLMCVSTVSCQVAVK